MIHTYRPVDLLLDNEIARKYYQLFDKYGFNIDKDRKKGKITDKEYHEIIQDISDPTLFTYYKGKLKRSSDGLIYFRKLYMNFRGSAKLLRVIVLVFELRNQDKAIVFPFHIYLKSQKKILENWENKALETMIDVIEKNEGELK